LSLGLYKSDDQSFTLLQTNWSAQLNPLLAAPSNNSIILKNVSLTTGSNTINTTLGRTLQGWVIVRQRAAASIHDNQDNNPNPTLTLVLISSANVVCDIEVF
jgi:hypothetical protein